MGGLVLVFDNTIDIGHHLGDRARGLGTAAVGPEDFCWEAARTAEDDGQPALPAFDDKTGSVFGPHEVDVSHRYLHGILGCWYQVFGADDIAQGTRRWAIGTSDTRRPKVWTYGNGGLPPGR